MDEKRPFPVSSIDLLALIQSAVGKGGSIRFKAHGGSMSPFIRSGDVVTVSPVGEKPVLLGEVVACRHPAGGGLVVHRVVGRKKGLFLIKGDGHGRVDGWVDRGRVLGRVVRVEREGKRVWAGLGKGCGMIALFSRSRYVFPWMMRFSRSAGALFSRLKGSPGRE